MTTTQDDKKSIKALKEESKNDTDFVKRIHAFLKTRYKRDSTRSVKISLFKKYILKEKLLDDPMMAKLISDAVLRTKLNSNRDNKELKEKTDIPQSVISQIFSYKDSDDINELLMYQLLISGRRVSEYLQGDWKIDEKTKTATTDVISKKRKAQETKDRYEIKLIDYNDFIKRHTLILELMGDRSIDVVRRAGLRFIRKTPSLRPIKNLADLRPLYVHIMANKEKYKNMNIVQATKELLLHENRSVSPFYVDRYNTIDFDKMTKKDMLKYLKEKNQLGHSKKNKADIRKVIDEYRASVPA